MADIRFLTLRMATRKPQRSNFCVLCPHNTIDLQGIHLLNELKNHYIELYNYGPDSGEKQMF
jgi:hypothetical protein